MPFAHRSTAHKPQGKRLFNPAPLQSADFRLHAALRNARTIAALGACLHLFFD